MFWKYYGPIGLLISVLFNVQLSLVNDHLDPPEWYSGTTFFVVVALIGVATFAIPLTPIRQIGSGLFVGVGVITLFPIMLYLVLFLVLPYFAYVATAVVCWIIATRTNAPTEESQPFGGGSPSP
ncbi:hypothetical protein GOARA_050_00740 [Gordonia araii NBRC 100433]|uniref:Uncharacterized protein n=1 Tax=Gordonia araii NBRC 100433 TaxID=1073574 RepID=G7H2D6_9ACTN|nr:hypothetical protein [Gordonia araii]NNG97550.1 hypothetical protein [Gordonia araii NBRC 100433]GAB10011.1 hypothetical protein GOARA_050_00740 [Gordonia araii NBRC 100433]